MSWHLLQSYLRYLSYLKQISAVLCQASSQSIFVPCSFLRERDRGSGVPFSSLGSATEVSPACAALQQALHAGEEHPSTTLPCKKTDEGSVVCARACWIKSIWKVVLPRGFAVSVNITAWETLFGLCWRIPLRLPARSHFLPSKKLRGASWCWLTPRDIDCSLLSGVREWWGSRVGVCPLLGDQELTQVPLQTYSHTEERTVQVHRQERSLCGCHFQPGGQKTLVFTRKEREFPKIDENMLAWVRPSKCLGRTGWSIHFQMSSQANLQAALSWCGEIR